MSAPASIPDTALVLAMSLDGKIVDVQRGAARFSSLADLAHLEQRVAAVDGVLFGGGTLRAYGTALPVRNPHLLAQRQQRGQPPQPLQLVWSPSGQLDPHSRFFQQPIPRGLITTAMGARSWDSEQFQRIWVMPESRTHPWDWPWLLAQLKQEGVQTLALLGGGTLAAELLRCRCVHAIYITVCPLLLGGFTAPTPVDRPGFLAAVAPRLQLLSWRAVADEVFLHYRVLPPYG